MPNRPSVVAVDVNETLSDLSPMAAQFEEVGAPAALAKLWFASLLRDGFALTAAGASQPFSQVDVDVGVLRTVLAHQQLDRDLDQAVEHVMSGFSELPVHPDVPEGVRALKEAGLRLVTLTNGSTAVGEQLFARAGLDGAFEMLLSVEDAGAWKPHPTSYAYAADRCGVPAEETLLVAVHPWDTDGAARAGLSTAWISRDNGDYPLHFRRPRSEDAGRPRASRPR